MEKVIKIKYSKKQLRMVVVFGLLWIGIFLIYALFRPESYFGYGYLVMALIFLALYVYKKVFHYAKIEDGILTKNSILPKRIRLEDVTAVHYFAGKYQLKTQQTEISINTMEIDPNSLKELKKILDHIKPMP